MITVIEIMLIILVVLEISSYIVYGKYIGDKYIYYILLQNKDKVDINEFNPTIFYVGRFRYITETPISIFNYYHIEGMGRVVRWSKSHKLLKELHKKALLKL